jgi:hypothetical protein
MTFYEIARNLHIIGGTVALITFWTTWILRKGTSRHRLVGRIYLIAIAFIIVTAVPLALASFERGLPLRGAFLLYLVVITGTPAWLAWRAIRDKTDVKRYTSGVYHWLARLSILSGAVILALGLKYHVFLLSGFSAVGIVTGALMLRFAVKPPTERNWWMSQHYGSIIATGVATHVAFINLGLSHLVPPEWSQQLLQFSFFSPLIIAVAARRWLDRKYGKKSYTRASSSTASANGRLMCSSFGSSRANFAKAIASIVSWITRTRASNPAQPSPSPGAVEPANPRY